jgi:hypothetical protein
MSCHKVFKYLFGENQISSVFVSIMRIVVVILNAMPLYVMNCEMNEWQADPVNANIVKAMFNAAVTMTLWSYFVASFVRPMLIPLERKQTGMCVHCNNWKPQRTHHCSVCKTCVPKMDHHCPWLGNCVGAHNFKPFFLFCVYQAITGMVYFYALVDLTLNAPDTFTLSYMGTFCFYMTNVFGMLISIALIPLSLRIMFQIYNNITSIEMMFNKQLRYPFYGLNSTTEVPNEYDLLWLNNLKQVLGPYIWLWPIPVTFHAA